MSLGFSVCFDDSSRRATIRLLRELQIHLASAIETSLPPGGGKPDPIDEQHLVRDRRFICDAEQLIDKLSRRGAWPSTPLEAATAEVQRLTAAIRKHQQTWMHKGADEELYAALKEPFHV